MKNFNADWIWTSDRAGEDEYAEFYARAEAKAGKAVFRIACDGMFELYVNGKIAGWGKYADFPHDRVADETEVTLSCGANDVAVRVWHIGRGSSTYRPGKAAAIFELEQDGKTLIASGADTMSRLSRAYENGRAVDITGQLGIGYRYDATREDDWTVGTGEGFAPSVRIDLPKKFRERPIERLRAAPPVPGRIVQQGVFAELPNPTAGRRLQHAGLFFIDPEDAFGERRKFFDLDRPVTLSADLGGRDGVYVVVDLGREDVGFLNLDFTVDEACEVEIGWGEHLADGRVRAAIESRGFACEYRAKAGANAFVNYFRRMGLRYLQIFFHAPRVTVRAAGILPVYYPLARKPRVFENALYQRIWDVSVRTLELCMHDHYEDTPWREQSLYAMDSRNQMLFGYIAFGERRFPKASLRLLAEGKREDGLLALCAPAGTDYPIPYFSLMFIVETAEYCAETGDYAFGEQMWDTMKGILAVHADKIGENGLVGNFTDREYWNFYEWTDGLDGYGDIQHTPSYDAPLNAFFLIALDKFLALAEKLGRREDALIRTSATVRAAANKLFYDSEKGLYASYIGKLPGHYAELTNALFVCAGIPDAAVSRRIADALADPGNDLVKISMSHSIFKYDALFGVDMKKYAPVVLREIETRYGGMLFAGATSFWETDDGEADFNRAGSLSHGWSAIPVYVFDKLGIK